MITISLRAEDFESLSYRMSRKGWRNQVIFSNKMYRDQIMRIVQAAIGVVIAIITASYISPRKWDFKALKSSASERGSTTVRTRRLQPIRCRLPDDAGR
jgi:hypothetical protein